jgi:hypothetical protein
MTLAAGVTRRGEMPFRPPIRSDHAEEGPLEGDHAADRAGLVRVENVFITPDGKPYAYSLNCHELGPLCRDGLKVGRDAA